MFPQEICVQFDPFKIVNNVSLTGCGIKKIVIHTCENDSAVNFVKQAEQTNVQNTSLYMLSSMLGYTRNHKYYDSNEPIFASVFTINHNVAKVSFTFGNPDRLIEFF